MIAGSVSFCTYLLTLQSVPHNLLLLQPKNAISDMSKYFFFSKKCPATRLFKDYICSLTNFPFLKNPITDPSLTHYSTKSLCTSQGPLPQTTLLWELSHPRWCGSSEYEEADAKALRLDPRHNGDRYVSFSLTGVQNVCFPQKLPLARLKC